MIILKSKEQIEIMREAGRISALALRLACEAAAPGVSTAELDLIAHDAIKAEGAKPAFLGYGGFPATICSSINNELVHGIPSKDRILQEGDVLKIDVGAIKDGFYGDNANTIGIGEISARDQMLIDTTRAALYAGIDQMVEGNYLSDIGEAIEKVAKSKGLGIVREYVGHGIGRAMHEDPNVFNFKTRHPGPRLRNGMVLAVEPMFTLGKEAVYTLDDGWTVVTKDGSNCSQIEHTIAITEDGPQILTLE